MRKAMEVGLYNPKEFVRPHRARILDPRINGAVEAKYPWISAEALERAKVLVVDVQKVGTRREKDKNVDVTEEDVDNMVDVTAIGDVVFACTPAGSVICAMLVNPGPCFRLNRTCILGEMWKGTIENYL